MFNPWSFAKYPEKDLTSSPEEAVIRQAGRLTFTKTQLIILCENGFKEKIRLNEITSLRLFRAPGVKHPALGFIFGLILILSFGAFGYYFVPRLANSQNPLMSGSHNAQFAGLLLIAIFGFTVAGFYLLYFTTSGGQWWWVELIASGQTYNLPVAKTKDISEQDLMAALPQVDTANPT